MGPQPRPVVSRSTPHHDERGSTDGVAADLSEDEHALFDTIRRWRAEVAEAAGVPRYVVLTNSNLEALVRTRPTTLTGLRKIRGIGKAKVEKYGEALLEMLRPPGEVADAADEPTPVEVERS